MAHLVHTISEGTPSAADERAYLQTHPWITYRVNFSGARPRFWMLLGEAQSKCAHIAGVPLRPSTAAQLHRVFLAKGVRATTAIEGNTLSEEEVSKRLEGKLDLPPSKEYLGIEIDNILRMCNEMDSNLAAGSIPPLSVARIKELNAQVLEGLNLEAGVVPGRFRDYSVGVGRYRGAPPQDCEYLIKRLCEWLQSPDFAGDRGLGRVAWATLKAVAAHLYLLWIHPFGDGNGRTARLVEFQILLSSGIPTPAAHLLSNHYNETRSEYYRHLDQAGRAGANPIEFIHYALQGFVDGLEEQLVLIMGQQWDVAWENYVHDKFSGRTTPADTRRRHLVLDLSRQSEPVPRAGIGQLSPRLAAAYAGKTSKTLTRDLNMLTRMGLVERSKHGVSARKEVILAFLPRSGPAATESTRERSDVDPQLELPLGQ